MHLEYWLQLVCLIYLFFNLDDKIILNLWWANKEGCWHYESSHNCKCRVDEAKLLSPYISKVDKTRVLALHTNFHKRYKCKLIKRAVFCWSLLYL